MWVGEGGGGGRGGKGGSERENDGRGRLERAGQSSEQCSVTGSELTIILQSMHWGTATCRERQGVRWGQGGGEIRDRGR